jgi:YVTN family beta-propeller protein
MQKRAKYTLVFLILLLAIVAYYAIGSMSQTAPPAIIKNITIGTSNLLVFPSVAINPNGKYAYATDDRLATLSVISTSNNTAVKTINVGVQEKTFPEGIAVSLNGSYVYVADAGSNTISVISTVNNTIIGNITIPDTSVNGNPFWVAVTPNDKYIYVSSGVLTVISLPNYTVIADMNVGRRGPDKITFSPDGKYAYATTCCSNSSGISVIATSNNTVISNINIIGGASDVAITADGKYLYAVGGDTNAVYVISTSNNSLADKINFGAPLFGIALSPDGKYLYVADEKGVSVISTSNNSIVYSINNVGSAVDVAVAPNGTRIYISSKYTYPSNFTPTVLVLSAPMHIITWPPSPYVFLIAILVILIISVYYITSKKEAANLKHDAPRT